MKSIPKALATVSTCVLLVAPTYAQGGGNGGGNGGGGNGAIAAYIDTLPLQDIDAVELAELVHMRQEEKIARDAYQVLYDLWGLQVFQNIAESEQSHMDLTLLLFERYGLPDPLLTDEVGVFPDPAMTRLFRKLVALGSQSSFDALVVGAIIEDLDIYDLELALADTDNLDVQVVWQNLARGSRNHLRAFYDLLAAQGFLFPGIWLETRRILAIVNAPVEPRPVDENGDPLR